MQLLEKAIGYMDFPGFDTFEPTAPLMHAIFTIREAIPDGQESIRVDFTEPGVVFCAAFGADGSERDETVDLSADETGAAGLLMEYLSYQLITLTRMHEEDGDRAVFAAQSRLCVSLAEFGLSTGLLDETLVDTITIARQ